MDSVILQMLEKYNCKNKEDYLNAIKEVVQEIALYSLSTTDFFDHAAFYGGTALRIFYNLDRFSEDLDFSLCEKDQNFSLKKYFKAIEDSFKRFGLNFVANEKEKTKASDVQSAFLKGNTLEHILLITPYDDISSHIQKNEVIKIKFEIDTNPPLGATYEYRYGKMPLPYKVRLYDESSLFAGKVHAVLCRGWQTRPKGRDFYDFYFYIKRNTLLNISHLQKRMEDSHAWSSDNTLTLAKLKELLKARFEAVDFNKAKEDVLPFISNNQTLKYWNKEFFNALSDQIITNEITLEKIALNIEQIGTARIEKIISTQVIARVGDTKQLNEYFESYISNHKLNYIADTDSLLNFGDKTELHPEYFILCNGERKEYFKSN